MPRLKRHARASRGEALLLLPAKCAGWRSRHAMQPARSARSWRISSFIREERLTQMDAGTWTVNQGVETTNCAGEALKRIIQMADQVDSMIAQIAAAMQQAAAARQSSESVDAINQLGEENAASI